MQMNFNTLYKGRIIEVRSQDGSAFKRKREMIMNIYARYHDIHDRHDNKAMVYDSETGAIQHPGCVQDLTAYYNYLMVRGRFEEAQKLQAESIAGNRPITDISGRCRNQWYPNVIRPNSYKSALAMTLPANRFRVLCRRLNFFAVYPTKIQRGVSKQQP
jgi:hypothetical protein